jgi:hypothetical protein
LRREAGEVGGSIAPGTIKQKCIAAERGSPENTGWKQRTVVMDGAGAMQHWRGWRCVLFRIEASLVGRNSFIAPISHACTCIQAGGKTLREAAQ